MFKRRKERRRKINALLSLLSPDAKPNLNALRVVTETLEPLALNIKQMGYELARQLAAALPPDQSGAPVNVPLKSSLSTQAAIASPWVAYWCGQMQIPRVYHRKIWELCYVLQALHNADLIRPGARGLGFGCGAEPIPSYLAAHGVTVTATDLAAAEATSSGWVATGQHLGALEEAFRPHLVTRAQFEQNVALRFVDMNAIPADMVGYDFCWSICALEHLGSLQQGVDFIENSLATLVPGGLAVHTTEFNIRDEGPTFDHCASVAFQRKHLEALAYRLEMQGHRVEPFDFSLGDGPLDRFVDMPPYHHELSATIGDWIGQQAHLKLSLSGLILTCVGLIIHKAPAGPHEPPEC